MSVHRLKRVMWRLSELGKKDITEKELRKAIMLECGYYPKTIKINIKALAEIGWIKRTQKSHWIITGREYDDD